MKNQKKGYLEEKTERGSFDYKKKAMRGDRRVESGFSFVYDKKNDRQKEIMADQSSIKIGIFIDGTSANSNNVKAREANKLEFTNDIARAYEKYHGDDDSSYENGHSNVYKLYDSYIQEDLYKNSVYIEGIGTVYNEKEAIEFDRYGKDDRADGVGYGKNINGIRGKVFKACEQAVEKCADDVKSITFDVFGFSRGAAAARNFIYEIFRPDGIGSEMPFDLIYSDYIDNILYSKASEYTFKSGFLGYLLNKKDLSINKVTIQVRFVGIFDTVASYSPALGLPSFESGARLLHMDDYLGKAKKVIHLNSQYEHRKNFALTPVSDTILQKREFYLPGVHSDIGGTYIDGAEEKKQVEKSWSKEKLEKRRKWLIDQRFFREGDLSIKKDIDLNNLLLSERASVNARYDRIPLKIVIDSGNEYDLFDEEISMSFYKFASNEEIKAREIRAKRNEDHNFIDELRPLIKKELKKIADKYMAIRSKSGIDQVPSFFNLSTSIDNLIFNMSDPKFVEVEYAKQNKALLAFLDNDLLEYTRLTIEEAISKTRKKTDHIYTYKSADDIISTPEFKKALASMENPTSVLLSPSQSFPEEEIVQQVVLRILRYRCLHWSANYKKSYLVLTPYAPVVNDNTPTENGIRLIHKA